MCSQQTVYVRSHLNTTHKEETRKRPTISTCNTQQFRFIIFQYYTFIGKKGLDCVEDKSYHRVNKRKMMVEKGETL